jgi:hypothetical protein
LTHKLIVPVLPNVGPCAQMRFEKNIKKINKIATLYLGIQK